MPTENATREKLLFPFSTSSIPFSSPSISLSLYFPILLCPLPLTLATKSTPHWSPDPRYQPMLPMPLRSSTRPSSIHSACPNPPVSVKPLISTQHLSVVSLFWLLTFWLLPTWFLLTPCPCRRAYRQPWPWRKEHRKLHDYKQLVEKEKNSNDTYGKDWGIHKIPKSVHLSHRLPPPITGIPISLANSLHRWRASGVSCGRY